MKKNLIVVSAFVLFVAVGCQTEKLVQAEEENSISEIRAYDGESQVKTVLAEDGTSVLWSPNDEISVHFNGAAVKFKSLNSEPASWTIFQSSTALLFGGTEGMAKPYIYGIYPYSDDNAQHKDTLSLTVPSVQTAVAGSFGRGCYPSIGRSVNTEMAFYNVCGGVRFTVSQEGINRVVFMGNNNESLAGKVNVVFDDNNLPKVASVVAGENQMTLNAPDDGTFEVGKWYYISMLPTCLNKGYTIKLYKEADMAEMKKDDSQEIKRSLFGQLADIDKGLTFKTGISKLILSETELYLLPMTAAQLHYTVYPENAEYEWIKWESNDKSVAKVDDDGLVTVLKAGRCVISIMSDNGTIASCDVYGDIADVTFNVSMDDEMTKASIDDDGKGAYINRCIMEIYYDDEPLSRHYAKVSSKQASFAVRLITNRTYKVAFWADCVEDPSTDEGLATDQYYTTDTANGLQNVAINGDHVGNNDARDARYASIDYTVNTSEHRIIYMKRPFGQLNIIFTDIDDLYSTCVDSTEFLTYRPCSLKVSAKLPTTFNVKTQTAGDPVTTALNITAAKDYLDNYCSHGSEETIFMDYFFATAGSSDVVDVDFNFTSRGAVIAHSFTNVPFQRNYRTNIKGALLTNSSIWYVTIDPTW